MDPADLQQARAMLDTAPAILWVTDASGYCTFLSRGWYEFTGQTEATALGAGWIDAVHPDDRMPAMQTFLEANARKAEFTLDYRLRRRDGEYRWAIDAGRPLFSADGTFVGYIGSVIDITERKRAEASLYERDQQFRQLTDSIREVFWLASMDGSEAYYVSPAFERVWGRTAQSLGAGPNAWLAAVHREDRARVHEWNAGRRVEASEIEYRIVQPGGAVRWIRQRAFPIVDAAGRTYRIAVTVEDITDRRELEEQLRHAQKMEAVGRLAAGVAHDFNNLLTIISGYTELAMLDIAEGQPGAAELSEVANAARRASALTQQLLAFGRKQVLTPRVIEINALVAEAEKMLCRLIGEDITLVAELNPDAGSVRADAGQLNQVLLNLAVNARDAMPDGGRLAISTARVTLDQAAAARCGLPAGSYVMLTVSDTGCGMSSDVRTHLFEPFFTTKEAGRGTGLGLATVYGIVMQSQGHIEVDSAVGRGTTFRIYLPQIFAPQESPARAAAAARTTNGECILLAEDDPGVRSYALRVLRRAGYKVLEASDAEDALRVSQEHCGIIHLVVTDVVMPGAGGRALVEQLTTLRPGIRALYISGYTDDAALRRGLLDEDARLLSKPFGSQALIDTVREVLESA